MMLMILLKVIECKTIYIMLWCEILPKIDANSLTKHANTHKTKDLPRKQIAGERSAILPEVDVFLRLLTTLFLLDNRRVDEASAVLNGAVDIVRNDEYARRRTLEPLSWRVERYVLIFIY
jgi:hypothetical protein